MEEEAGAITLLGQTVIKVGTSRSQSKTPAGSPWASAWETLSFTDPRAGSRDTEGGEEIIFPSLVSLCVLPAFFCNMIWKLGVAYPRA